jgi:drug/metabolite transporter (DMT)-like permease
MRYKPTTYTVMGLVAIVFWSATIAVSRSLAEQIGALTAGACMWLAGGILGCLYAGLIRCNLGCMIRLPRAYLLGCGACFVAYMVCLYLAIGLAANRQQTLEVGILNYLWPSLTLVLAVPILGVRVRPAFWAGVALALAGAALAPLRPEEYSAAALAEYLRSNPAPYLLAAAAGLLWALYSCFSRRWGAEAEGGAVPLFALAAGAVLGVLALAMPALDQGSLVGPRQWSPVVAGELAFMALFPVLVAYAFWDAAMRRGRVPFVAACSYAIPLVSTVISSVYLSVVPAPTLWIACGLVIVGALLCQRSLRPSLTALP